MKKSLKISLSVFLLICFLTGLCSCRKSPDSATSSSSISTIGEGESETDKNSVTDSVSESISNSTTNSSSTTGSKKTAASSTVSNGSSKELSWAQVLENMPKELKGTTIEVYDWNAAKDVTGLTKVLSDFEKKTGIKVKYTQGTPDNYATEVAARISAQNSPDIIRMRTFEPARIQQLQPLSVAGYDFSDKAWDSDTMNYYSVNGKSYATNMRNSLLNNPYVMYYNKDFISKYDLEDPIALWKSNQWTFDKFKAICGEFKAETGKTPWGARFFNDYMLMYGLQGSLSYDGKAFGNNLNNTKVISAAQTTCDLIQSGFLNTSYRMEEFTKGEHLFYSSEIIGARRTHFFFQSMKSNGTLGIVPMPSISGQSTYYQIMSEYQAFGIAKGAKNPKAVPYFLRYYLDAQNYDQNAFFNDKTMLDVYRYCMNQGTRVASTTSANGIGFSFERDMLIELESATSAQVTSIYGKYAPTIGTMLNQLNQTLTQFPK